MKPGVAHGTDADTPQAAEALRRRIALERLVVDISARLIKAGPAGVDDEINRALAELGQAVRADRSYVFALRSRGDLLDNTHEWCAEGVPPEIQNLQGIVMADDLPWLAPKLRRLEAVVIPSVASLPEEAAREREQFEQRNVQSLIVVPMAAGDALVGLVGFDSVRRETAWPSEVVDLLRILADLIASTIHRKKAEQALRQSETTSRRLFANNPLPMFVYDLETLELLDVNHAATQSCGYSRDELLSMRITDIRPSEGVSPLMANMARGRPGLQRSGVLQHRAKDGRLIEVEIDSHETDFHGRPAALVVAQDVTERLRAERALAESEARYRSIVEETHDLVQSVAPDGRLLFVNRAWKKTLGYSEQEIAKLGLWDIIHPDSRTVCEGHFRRLAEGATVQLAATFLAKDGSRVMVEGTAVGLLEGGRLSLTHAVLRDVTQRQKMEEALERERASLAQRVGERTAELSAANAQLAGASRAKDEFLAGMSHELRTPLNAILSLAEMLSEEVQGPLNEKQARSVRMMEESGRHLLSLINDILDLAKVGAGKLDLRLGPVQVAEVCQASLRFVQETAHKRRLRLATSLDSRVTAIRADERRLKQILVNLLSNAVKFTPEGGELGLRVEADAERELVRFTVWDTGIGIEPEKMEKLFRPFVQLDSGLARQHEGTGLGLSLVSRLADLHGGSVSVESEGPGQGSRFTVSLPWNESEPEQEEAVAAEKAADSEAQAPAAGTLILLAEDNETNIATMSDYLEAKGYRLVVARNGGEAVDRAREERPALILMDIQMPGMDGLEATRRIREDGGLQGVPIIALTALAMPGDRERCLAAGANEYMSKPVSLKGLVKHMEALLGRETA